MGKALGKQTLEMEFYLGALIVIVPGYLLLYSFFNLYTPKRVLGRRNEFGKILKANTIGLLIFGLVLYFGRKEPHLFNFSQRLVVYFYGINVLMITAERNAIRMVLGPCGPGAITRSTSFWWDIPVRPKGFGGPGAVQSPVGLQHPRDPG